MTDKSKELIDKVFISNSGRARFSSAPDFLLAMNKIVLPNGEIVRWETKFKMIYWKIRTFHKYNIDTYGMPLNINNIYLSKLSMSFDYPVGTMQRFVHYLVEQGIIVLEDGSSSIVKEIKNLMLQTEYAGQVVVIPDYLWSLAEKQG